MKKYQNDVLKFVSLTTSCIVILMFAFCILNFSYAKEITILYTGDTHAMLYTCSCPIEKDGGVARRAALLAQLRKENPSVLVLDSGGFFAGGVLDEYTQNTELDTQRTLVNLKAMELMRYDAAGVGASELNFGKAFLEEQIKNTRIAFASCNMKSEILPPYLIKEVEGLKIGIIGVTGVDAVSKSDQLRLMDPKKALTRAVQELRQKKADCIIVLSQMEREVDVNILKEVEGIDVAILGHSSRKKEDEFGSKVNSMIVVRPSWQGRHLNKLTLTFADNKIKEFKNEELRLSDEIKDAPEIAAIVPQCFSAANCKQEGATGACNNPGTQNARCEFTPATPIELSVIELKEQLFTETRVVVSSLKERFPGLKVEYVYYPDDKAKKLVKEFGIKTLPAFIFNKEIQKDVAFDTLKENLEVKNNSFLLKPQIGGLSYFLERPRKPEQFDLFVSAYDKRMGELLKKLKGFKPYIHFLVMEKDGGFEAALGPGEVEESLRMVCVQKHAPSRFLDYLNCRSASMYSAWWEDCVGQGPIEDIRVCAKGPVGKELLKQSISLSKELQIMFGPTYLMENREIFSSRGVPSQEEFKKFMKKQLDN